jgi:hypothetical protein
VRERTRRTVRQEESERERNNRCIQIATERRREIRGKREEPESERERAKRKTILRWVFCLSALLKRNLVRH